jgi:hypothetical protein
LGDVNGWDFFLQNVGKKCEGWEKSAWTTISVFSAVKSMRVPYSTKSSHTYQIVDWYGEKVALEALRPEIPKGTARAEQKLLDEQVRGTHPQRRS